MAQPPDDFLADVYRHLPFLVVHITVDGVVLHCNPATSRLTGYEERELVGKNFWGTLFPGKLFAQVPKVISSGQAGAAAEEPAGGDSGMSMFKDMPMTIRTKEGHERIIALSRYVHVSGGGRNSGDASDSARRSMICVGIDLTDRLVDAERDRLPPEDMAEGLMAFGPHIGNAGTIEGEFVTPLAISPPSPRQLSAEFAGQSLGGTRGPTEQANDCLVRLEAALLTLKAVLGEGELHVMTALAEALRDQHSRGFEFVVRGDLLHVDEARGGLMHLQARAEELVALYRKDVP